MTKNKNLYQTLVLLVIKVVRIYFYNTKLKNNNFVIFVYDRFFHSAYKRSSFISVETHGVTIKAPAKDITILPTLLNNSYESTLLSFMESYLTKGMVFVDVGANIGIHSSVAARTIAPYGEVYSFEPMPENFELLISNVSENIQLNSAVKFYPEQLAVSNILGESTLFLDGDSIGTHSLASRFAETRLETINVKTTTLDSYFDSHHKNISMLKIDIEGHELEALSGASKLLLKTDVLLIEFDCNHFSSKQKIEEFVKLVSSFKFVFIVDEIANCINETSFNELNNLNLSHNLILSKKGFNRN